MNKMKQKAIILRDNDNNSGTNKLNTFLDAGWFVFQMCDMSSSRSGGGITNHQTAPTCLVILQREE